MTISKKRAKTALLNLLDKGFIVPDQEAFFEGTIQQGLSYKMHLVTALGNVTGTLFANEQEAEYRIVHSMDIHLEHFSVPEAFLLEDNQLFQPWHREKFSESAQDKQFQQEAGEPWHISLNGKYTPDEEVVRYFKKYKDMSIFAKQVLVKAYGYYKQG